MDKAKQSLANFEADFEEFLGDALVKKGTTEAARDVAEDSLTAFLINPTRDIQEGEFIDVGPSASREGAWYRYGNARWLEFPDLP